MLGMWELGGDEICCAMKAGTGNVCIGSAVEERIETFVDKI